MYKFFSLIINLNYTTFTFFYQNLSLSKNYNYITYKLDAILFVEAKVVSFI